VEGGSQLNFFLCFLLLRLLNLELLLKYGAKAWQAHIAHLEAANRRCAQTHCLGITHTYFIPSTY